MEGYKVIGKRIIDCPICDEEHEVEVRERISKTIIKDEEIEYKEIYLYCENADEDENEFVIGKMLNANLLSARNAYRKKHNLLTSDEIVGIRNNYGLSQVELAKLLGWGEATISRYESKAIQDDAYDNILKLIRDNPMKAIELLDKNKSKFTNERYSQIRQTISKKVESYGKEFLSRQSLESEYLAYNEKSIFNGNKLLDIDKIESMISYIAQRCKFLYKVKLIKMIWYADTLSYIERGYAMTGLVYQHKEMGALPIGHNQIVNLENVIVKEEIFDYDSVKYHFLKNEELDLSNLTKEDIAILDIVINKFKAFSAANIVEYMHKEIAYERTAANDIITYDLAQYNRKIS